MSIGDNSISSNVFCNHFTFKNIIQLLSLQQIPRFFGGRYHLEAGFFGADIQAIKQPFDLFSSVKEGMGKLTRDKIEQITQKSLDKTLDTDEELFTVYRGRAGTGKTIKLIQKAIKLVDEKDARVVLLTYNRALVSDIRRLFALAELPDLFDSKCVGVMTMQSYFYTLINESLFSGKLTGDEFITDYEKLVKQLIDFIKTEKDSKDYIKLICDENDKLRWDYVLIDEAQDWTNYERDLITLLYDSSHIFAADGGGQFVRNIDPCDWSVIRERKNVRLKLCLRQKNNLIKFVNHFCEEMDYSHNHINASEKMPGGEVIIVTDKSQLLKTIRNAKRKMILDGNIGYDMLILATNELVTDKGEKSFLLKREFEDNGILVWDGINDSKRLEYPVDNYEARALQYESSRGLEGWVVCCLDFDSFLERKEQLSLQNAQPDKLLLESAEETRKKFVRDWALIPLTRPIDTLIISIKDLNSRYSKTLLKLAKMNPDYITVI